MNRKQRNTNKNLESIDKQKVNSNEILNNKVSHIGLN